jgi:methylglutaconyl-CoA hydratase
MTYKTIEIQTAHSVAVLWLNRPEVRNAFNETMIAELTAAFGGLEADAGVRAVVLAGRGKVFCAGADVNWMKRMGELDFEENRKDAMTFGVMLNRLHALKKPTIARVHGAAIAGGMGLVAACDIAVASTDTEFCVSEVRLGLTPATIGPYVLAAMGERAAHRYFLTAERFPAAEAYRIGFVQELVQPEELDASVNAILGQLVQGAPGAQAAAKDLIRSAARQRVTPELMADMAARIAGARASDEGREGVRAFLEKRSPAWVPQIKRSAKGARNGKESKRRRT